MLPYVRWSRLLYQPYIMNNTLSDCTLYATLDTHYDAQDTLYATLGTLYTTLCLVVNAIISTLYY